MKKTIKNIFFIFLFCLSQQTIAQDCVTASFIIPDCITANTPITFINNSIDLSTCNTANYEWEVYDENFDFLFGSVNFDLNYTFPSSGTYYISLYPDIPGPNSQCCQNSGNGEEGLEEIPIYVIDLPVTLNVNNNIEICSNGSIDYDISSPTYLSTIYIRYINSISKSSNSSNI